MKDRTAEINLIIEKIDLFLEGELSTSDAGVLGLSGVSEAVYSNPPTEHDLLVGEGWGALLMLSESEPEEFRTTGDQLNQVRAWLAGDEKYPYEEKLQNYL